MNVLTRAVVTTSFAAAVTAGLLAAPVLATAAQAASNTATAHAGSSHAVTSRPARLPLSAAQLQSYQRQHNAALSTTSSITGVASSAAGVPLAGVCVTAYGPTRRSAVTSHDGRFLISGLRPGSYQVEYRSCAGGTARYVPEWYGDVLQRGESAAVIVGGSSLTPVQALAPVRLYPANSTLGDLPGAVVPQQGSDEVASDPFGRLATAPSSPAAMMREFVARYASGAAEPAARGGHGRISGVVTSPNGRGLQGICVLVASENVGITAVTSKNGSYRTPRLPAGTYFMAFYADCGNTGNWLFQIYKGIYNPAKAPTPVRVKAGRTGHISAVMKEGGEISGTVTGPGGRKLDGICVDPLTNAPAGQLVLAAVSRQGVYHIRSVPAGSYQIGFAPCQAGSDWAPTLWPDTQNYNTAPHVPVHGTQDVGNIDEVMQPGGIITGTVTAATSPPTPLAGMCVYVSENNGLFDSGNAASSASGSYEITGLAPGSYSVQFMPGCDSNGNYVAVSYPSNVNVIGGATTPGINGSLPLGATISGTVTSAVTGEPLAGVCVQVSSAEYGAVGFEATGADGTYSVDQLPVDTYQVQFSGGCGNAGSYAPQAWDNTNVLEPQNIEVSTAGQNVTGIGAAMQPGPVISGNVTDSSGHGLNGICVLAGTASGVLFDIVPSFGGQYQLPDLAPGSYEVIFSPGCGDNADLATEAFRSDVNGTTPATVSVTSGTLSGVDAVMQAAGGISGVVRTASGSPLQLSCMILTGVSGSARSLLDETVVPRKYELTGLPAGGYQVAFVPSCVLSNLETQWYKGRPSPAGATRVVIRASRIDAHINSSLVPGGSIFGQLTNDGKPVHNMCVTAQNVTQPDDFGGGITHGDGKFYIRGLNSGEYELSLESCGDGTADLANEVEPQLVSVTAPRTTTGVNITVPFGDTITGTVLAGSPPSELGGAGACVEAFATSGDAYNSANTGLDGAFSIANLPPGQYVVYVGDPECSYSEPDLAPQWYLGKSSAAAATRVMVGVGTTSLSDTTLADDGSINGTVTVAGGGPLRGVCVAATEADAGLAPVYSVTSRTGGYSITDLPAGDYLVQFSSGCGASGYKTQWWQHKSTEGGATIVTVTAGTATAGIGAALRK